MRFLAFGIFAEVGIIQNQHSAHNKKSGKSKNLVSALCPKAKKRRLPFGVFAEVRFFKTAVLYFFAEAKKEAGRTNYARKK